MKSGHSPSLPRSSGGTHLDNRVCMIGKTVPWARPAIILVAQTASQPPYLAATGTKIVAKPQVASANANSFLALHCRATILPGICVQM